MSASKNFKPRHAHELEAAGDPRWEARVDSDGLVMVRDLASGEETQATAYTVEGNGVRFALAGGGGMRFLAAGEPGHEEFVKALEKSPAGGGSEPGATRTRASNEKATAGQTE